MKRSQKHGYKAIFWILVIAGSIFILGAVSFTIDTLVFLEKAKSVSGIVIELVPNGSSDRHFQRVAFWEETTERRFEFIAPWSLKFKVYKEDERITVFYDPENPENARIGDWRNLFGLEIIVFIFGYIFFQSGFLSLRKRRKIMRQKKM